MDKKEISDRRAEARQRLLAAIDGWDEEKMTSVAVCGHWTAREVLAHICGWTRWDLETINALRAGEPAELSLIDRDPDTVNDRFVLDRSERTVAQILNEMGEIWTAMDELIARLPEKTLFEPAPFTCEYWDTFAGWLQFEWEHDEEHAAELEAW